MGSKIVISLLIIVLLAGLAYGALGIYRLQSVPAVHNPAQPDNTGFEWEELYGHYYATIGDHIYFASFGGYMYRVNLQNLSRELYLQMPVFGIATDEESLFFAVANDGDTVLVSYSPQTGYMQAITNILGANANIRYHNGMIFFVDNAGQIRSILPCGRPVATHSPTNVATFEVRLPLLIFTERNCYLQKEYNMNTGEINFP